MDLRELRARVARESRTLAIPVELRATDGKDPSITGHAAVFDSWSEDLGGFVERIQRGAFRKALGRSADAKLLWEHDPRWTLASLSGGTLRLAEDATGLGVDATPADVSYYRDLRTLMERGDVHQMSFGFTVAEGGDVWEERDGKVTRTITEVDRIYDVSIVAFPAYPATAAAARSLDAATDQVVEKVVRALSKSGVGFEPGAQSSPVEELDATGVVAEPGDTDDSPQEATGDEESRDLATAWRRAHMRRMTLPLDSKPRTKEIQA